MDDLSCFLTINATHDNKYENDYKDLGDLILQMLIGNTSQNIELSSEANSIIDDLTNKKKYENIKKHLFFNSLDWIKLENGQLNPPLKPDLNSFNFELISKKNNNNLNKIISLTNSQETIEYLNNEIEIINESVLFCIKLRKFIGKGGFGKV